MREAIREEKTARDGRDTKKNIKNKNKTREMPVY